MPYYRRTSRVATKTGTAARIDAAYQAAKQRRYAQMAANRSRLYHRGRYLSRGELKARDYTGTLAVNSATTLQLINGIARTDDLEGRIGRQILMKSIQIKGILSSTATTGVRQFCRMLVVYDNQTNGNALAATDVLNQANVYDPRNLDNRMRFLILFDQTYAVQAPGVDGSQHVINYYKKISLPTTYNSGDAGTVADIATGSLYMIFIGTEAAGDTDANISVAARVRYLDN